LFENIAARIEFVEAGKPVYDLMQQVHQYRGGWSLVVGGLVVSVAPSMSWDCHTVHRESTVLDG
jgi:hypothetical protein